MQAAFFGVFVLPPPPASPELLAHADGPCTRRATDAWVKLIVKGVVVHLVHFNVVPNIPQVQFTKGLTLVKPLLERSASSSKPTSDLALDCSRLKPVIQALWPFRACPKGLSFLTSQQAFRSSGLW